MESSRLTLDITKHKPVEFLRKSYRYTIWKGPVDGKGLSGKKEIDLRNSTLKEIDFSVCELITLRTEERDPNYEQTIAILKRERPDLILGNHNFFQALLDNYQRQDFYSVLEYFREVHHVHSIDFPGVILRSSGGYRNILTLQWAYSRSDPEGDCLPGEFWLGAPCETWTFYGSFGKHVSMCVGPNGPVLISTRWIHQELYEASLKGDFWATVALRSIIKK